MFGLPSTCFRIPAFGYLLLLCLVSRGYSQDTMDRVVLGDNLVIPAGETVTEAVVIGGNLAVYGKVLGDAVVVGGNLVLGSIAEVGGNAVAVGGRITRENGAQVAGSVTQVTVPGISTLLQAIPRQGRDLFMWPVRIFTFIGFLALGLLIVAVLPTPVNRLAVVIYANPLPSLLWGLLGTVLIVPVTLILIISLVGILLIPLLFVLIGLAALIGYIAAGREIGRRISEATGKIDTSIFLDTAVGLVLLWLVGWVPLLGFVIKTVVGLAGFGAVLISLPLLRKQPASLS